MTIPKTPPPSKMSHNLDSMPSQAWEEEEKSGDFSDFKTPSQDLEVAFTNNSRPYLDYVVDALSVFVPDYDDTVSKVALRSFLDGLSQVELEPIDSACVIQRCLMAKGYPRFWINGLMQQFSKARSDKASVNRISELAAIHNRGRREYQFEPETHKKRPALKDVYAPSAKAKGNKRVAEMWRVPWHRVRHFPAKPQPFIAKNELKGFSPAAFRKWGMGECTRLSSQLKKNTQFISGNHAAETLWYMTRFNGRQRDLIPLMSSARFFVEDYEHEVRRRGLIRARTNGFVIHGHFIENLDQLREWSPLFTRDKPLFRTMWQHYSDLMKTNKSAVDVSRVQRTIDLKFNLAPEVAIASIPDEERPFSPTFVDKPEERHYLNALAKPWFPPTGEGFKIIPDVDHVPFGERLRLAGLAAETKLTYQGLNQSKPVIMEHHVNSDSVSNAASTLLGAAATSTVQHFLRPTIQIVSFLTSFFQATTWQQMISSLTQFISGNELAWSYCSLRLQTLSRTQYQGGDGVFDSITKPIVDCLSVGASFIWEALVGAGIFTLIQVCMKEAAGHLFEPIKDMIQSIRQGLNRQLGMSIAQSVLDAIKNILGRIKKCWEAKSLMPLLGEQWDPSIWDTYVTSYMEFRTILTMGPSYNSQSVRVISELVGTGKLPEFWIDPVSPQLFIERCDELRIRGEKLASYFRTDTLVCGMVVRKLSHFNDFLNPLRSKAVGVGLRVQPYLLEVFGGPGGGKSNLCRHLWNAVKSKYGLCENGIYDWNSKENFPSGLDHTKWGVDFDDQDTSIAPLAANVPTHIESLIGLVNNNPFKVEDAVAQDKGKGFAAPLLVIVKTNFIDCRASKHTLEPQAFWRRIRMHVTLSAKDDFGSDGILDAGLAEMSDTWDMYNIDIRYFDPKAKLKENRDLVALTPPERVTFTQFVDRFYSEFDAWIALQRRLVAASTNGGSVCRVCHFPISKSCGHPQEETGYQGMLLAKCATVGFEFAEAGISMVSPIISMIARPTFDWMTGRVLHNAISRLTGGAFWTTIGATLVAAGALATLLEKTVTVVQGRVANGVEGLIPFNWFRAEQNYIPGLPPATFATTYTKDDLLRALERAFIGVYGHSTNLHGHGWMVANNTIVFPTHFAPSLGDEIDVTIQLRKIRVQLTVFNRRLCENPELTLIKIGSIMGTGGLQPFIWPVADQQVVSFDEVEIVIPTTTYKPTANKVIRNSKALILETTGVTKLGDCGGAYVARVGNSWRIVAMHYALHERTFIFGPTTSSLGAIVTTTELERLATSLATDMQGVRTEPLLYSKKPEQTTFVKYPYKSEVWAAVSHHGATPYTFGTISPPMSGSTLKTKVKMSLLADPCSQLIQKWTGSLDYWRLPDFRGEMVGDKWTSPYTASFETENRAVPHDETVWMAIADYLSGVDKLDVTGYAELSEEQIFTGVRGSYVNKINVQTSVGPPFNQSKKMHVAFSDEGIYMSPEIWRIFDALQGCLRCFIPAALGLCTLKDEALRAGKSPRVFVVFSFAFNMLLKQKGASWKCFMRANVDFFESCVGVNMTGIDAHRLVESLRVLNPGLDSLFSFDSKRLDKSYNGEWYDAICLVIYAMSWVVGTDSMGNYTLARGLKHCRYSMKNDVFSCFHNGSGNDWTVELNGLFMSLLERYLYYRGKTLPTEKLLAYMEGFFSCPVPDDSLSSLCDFRKRNVLRTYGDDEVLAKADPIRPDYFDLCRTEAGVIKTNADKSEGIPKPSPITDTQFLKRTFVWHSDSQRWVGQLDLKSMARMLAVKKDSQLTMPDHASVSLTECLRECVYYGKGMYDEVRTFFLQVSQDLGLNHNTYLRLPEYEIYLSQIIDGTFQTWVDRGLLLFSEENVSYFTPDKTFNFDVYSSDC